VNEQDEKDFEEYAFKMGIPPWHKYPHKITWLEGRRILREKQEKGCLMDEDEEFNCPIHGKLGGIDECPKC